jgi:site-specific DNA-methyltransferase (adenine-specific)
MTGWKPKLQTTKTEIIKTATLHNMDCMDLLKATPDKFYDLAIVDPPYGINVNMNMGVRKGEKVKHKQKNWDIKSPSKDYFDELKRVSINQIIWGANNFVEYLTNSSGWIFWDKQITGDVDFSHGELAFSSFNKSLKMVKIPIQSNYINEQRIHPTQKPVKLYEWLLSNYAKQGDKILDTHLGSMSSVIACLNLGFEITGCELDSDYFDSGIERVKKSQQQQRLF